MALGPLLGPHTWSATLYELTRGEANDHFHYKWCREEWALIISGTPTLRHADGETTLSAGDICCLAQGPDGAHQFHNTGEHSARLVVFSAPAGQPMSAFYPDDGTVLVAMSDDEGFLFNDADRIDDYWDGEPGAG